MSGAKWVWLYEHMPDKVLSMRLQEPDNLILINSKACPLQKIRLCERSACCLGAIGKGCRYNKCHNVGYTDYGNIIPTTSKERGVVKVAGTP